MDTLLTWGPDGPVTEMERLLNYSNGVEWLVPLIPGVLLFSFLLHFLFGDRVFRGNGAFAVFLSFAAFAGSIFMLTQQDGMVFLPEWKFFSVGGWEVSVQFLHHPTTWYMLTAVTGTAFLVHIFSAEYMKGDPKAGRYWAYLGLFTFAMCGLVLMQDLLLIFLFWELVGMSSYLLIGFWHANPINAAASQKAFIVNRIGDAAFLTGMGLMLASAGSLDLGSIYSEDLPIPLIAGFCFILAAAAKSAQFPLQVWLPDAMAGPTPASALIHAATMVAAGVFLLVRLLPQMQLTHLEVIALMGGITAVAAAVAALRENDIKKVLAWSTVSQLGFMFMGIGSGAPDAAFFHLLTHAAFKCGLFLAAGSVIHALHVADKRSGTHGDAQDMRRMGGLFKKLPLTFTAYAVFTAALVGLPFTGGFLSKEGILEGVLQAHHVAGGVYALIAILAFAGVLLTALYMGRHAWLVFGGKERLGKAFGAIKENNGWMALPLILLALASFSMLWMQGFGLDWEASVFYRMTDVRYWHAMGPIYRPGGWVALLAMSLSVLGLAGGWYLATRERANGFRSPFPRFTDRFYDVLIAPAFLAFSRLTAVFDKKFIDGAVNGAAKLLTARKGLARISRWWDEKVIDGLVNGIAGMMVRFGQGARSTQSGRLQTYLVFTMLGILVIALYLIYFGG